MRSSYVTVLSTPSYVYQTRERRCRGTAWLDDPLPLGHDASVSTSDVFIHPSAYVDEGAQIGTGSKVWHFTHVMPKARIGANTVIGQGCYIANVDIGSGVRIQNNVSVYDSVTLEDDVFCGPSCVFTNVYNPRSEVARKDEYRATLVRKGASIGANATIVCGATIGEYAFIGAGAVVREDVLPRALMVGVPAKRIGWMCNCGCRLPEPEKKARGLLARCTECSRGYWIRDKGAELMAEDTQ